MSESVDIVIKAQNQASAGIEAAAKSVDHLNQATVKTNPSLRAFNSILSTTELGKYSLLIGNTVNSFSDLRQMLQQASSATMLFKASLVATAGVIGFQIGQAINAAADELTGFNDQLEETIKRQQELSARAQKSQSTFHKNKMEDLQDIEDPQKRLAAAKEYEHALARELESKKENLQVTQEALDASEKWYRVDETKQEVAMLKEQRDEAEALYKQKRDELDAVRELTSARAQQKEADKAAAEQAKAAAEQQKRFDEDRRKTADEMWQREAEAQAAQAKSQKNAADGARRLREELQERFRKIRDDGNEKQRESDRQGFIKQMEWEFEEEDKYIEESNKKYREKVKAQKEQMKDTPQWQAFESRMLSRGNSMKPEEKVAKNTEEMNKKLERQAKQQEEANTLLRKIAEKTGSDLEGF